MTQPIKCEICEKEFTKMGIPTTNEINYQQFLF